MVKVKDQAGACQSDYLWMCYTLFHQNLLCLILLTYQASKTSKLMIVNFASGAFDPRWGWPRWLRCHTLARLFASLWSSQWKSCVAVLARNMTNSIVPWEDFRALMANCLIALEKCPGVRPIGLGESL